MFEDDKLNDPLKEEPAAGGTETPRRRRRSEMHSEERADSTAPTEPAEAGTPAAESTEPAKETGEESAVQSIYSRVPPEARRMTASPYGDGAPVTPRRPGTRPQTAPRRPPVTVPERRPVRSAPVQPERPAAERPAAERPERPAAERTERPAAGTSDATRSFDAAKVSNPAVREGETSRVSVGYAPGRMNLNPRTASDYVRDIRNAQEYGRNPAAQPQQQSRGDFGASTMLPEDQPIRDRRKKYAQKHPVTWVIVGILLVIGLALTILLSLPEDNSIRKTAADAARTITQPIQGFLEKREAPVRIETFDVTGDEETIAPADVIITVTTDKSIVDLRLADEEDRDLRADQILKENTENNIWTLTLRVKDGYEGVVKLQALREEGKWMDTEHSVTLAIAPPLAASGSATPGPAEPTATPENYGDDMWGVPWGGTEAPEATATPEPTPAPTDTPEPTPEPTPTPALEAVADPSADPALIISSTVYDGSKKIKNYVRAAKSLIHMPAGDDYTPQKIGILTFRGNAFRQNAAIGTIKGANELEVIWQVEAGGLRGASQYFYGYEWTGQPAIVKWSKQVRAGSNIDEGKKEKEALREVIIAGSDGVIRFLDLEDGVVTRNPINVGYPMRGTPSLHPAGYPYMTVGQYTRKLKNKTGSIGLRQFNLYNQKEQKLIDGLDGKLHRGINRIGSFETSALIDRNSDTLITVGTNGLVYLMSLNTSFDYQAATLSTDTKTIVLATKAKGQKKTERVAVESSHAMYDRYIFYADMGGVLRCVDTNYLTTEWAVETGDSVMAAVALDLSAGDTLDLYTANMLSLRKSGPAQIRKYNALTGKEIWTLEIGVSKNSKTKEDVGVKASPVIGQNSLKGLVYFTVTGLNEEGRAALEVAEGTKAAVVAIDKETGEVRWAKGLSDRTESSPVAVYDADGNGWIIQCAESGEILMMEGKTGKVVAELQLDANIQASPAVYNDYLVIGTTGKGTSYVVGIRIK